MQFFGDGRCESARTLSSIELDGDLSEVERALLDDHLRACPACVEVRRGMQAMASLLREAPLERPSASPLSGLSARALPRPRVALRLAAAAAVAALAAAFGVLTAMLTAENDRPPVRGEPDIALLPQDERRDLRELGGRGAGAPERRRIEGARVGGA